MTPALKRFATVVVLSICLVAVRARADEIVLGPSDFFVSAQPEVTIQMEYPVNSGIPFGDPVDFYLDTGTSGIMFATGSYETPDFYNVQHRSDGSTVQYLETGVAGTQLLDVFEPHDFYFAGSDGTTSELPNVRPYGSFDVDLGDVNGLAGMPTMVNRVTHLDLQNQLDMSSDTWGTIGVSFQTTAPQSPRAGSARYHVPLRLEPPSFPGVDPNHPDDPKPTFAPVPFVVGLGHTFVDHQGQTHTVYRDALLDTGAQNPIISHQLALDLGVNLDPKDPNTDIEDLDGNGVIDSNDYVGIGGLGGEVSIPFIHLAKLSIPTKEGTYISITDVDAGVFVDEDGNSLDIPGVDAILGMNILTSGYLEPLLEEALDGTPATGGFINDVTLNFLDPNNPEMLLDVNVPEPAIAGLLMIGIFGLSRRKRVARRVTAAGNDC